ncbi:MAG TPA: hypothetical protein VIP48_02750 [Streptosporangiaceae bacterium]
MLITYGEPPAGTALIAAWTVVYSPDPFLATVSTVAAAAGTAGDNAAAAIMMSAALMRVRTGLNGNRLN